MLNLTGEVKYKRNMSRFPSRPKNYLIERIHHVLPLPVREYLLIHLSNRKHLPCSINVLLPITRGVVLCFDSVPLHRSAQFGCAKILRTPKPENQMVPLSDWVPPDLDTQIPEKHLCWRS